MGVAFMELEMYEDAVDRLEKYARANTKDQIANFLLAKSYYLSGQNNLAIAYFKKVLMVQPQDFRSHYYSGECYMGLGRYDTAAKSFKKALNINPDDARTHYSLGITYIELDKFRSANNELSILYMLDRDLYNSLNQILQENQ
jgi:tetratricopeptide (TPR) repeat protein